VYDVDRNKATARRIYEELFDQRRLDVADEVFAPGFRSHAAWGGQDTGDVFNGPEGIKQLVTTLHAIFSDTRSTIEGVVGEADRVVVWMTWSGTQTGNYMGQPATSRRFNQRQMHLYRFDEQGRAVDHWGVRDDLGLMGQLGLLPSAPPD
jgi:predicted ester cyclase